MRAFLVVTLLGVVAVVAAAVDQESGLSMWLHLRGELRASEARIEQLAGETSALKSEIDALTNDPFALERAIREDLELGRPGEVIVRFGRISSSSN